MKRRKNRDFGAPKWGLVGALTSAFGASACCLGPLAILALGAGGAWAGQLAAMEIYRPLFSVASFLFLGLAFYRVYRKRRMEACASGESCGSRGKRKERIAVWLVATLVVLLLSFPFALPFLVAGG